MPVSTNGEPHASKLSSGLRSSRGASADTKDGARRALRPDMSRYTHVLTGGPVMPTMDLHAIEPPRGAETRPTRSTSNAVALVVEGEGESTIGD